MEQELFLLSSIGSGVFPEIICVFFRFILCCVFLFLHSGLLISGLNRRHFSCLLPAEPLRVRGQGADPHSCKQAIVHTLEQRGAGAGCPSLSLNSFIFIGYRDYFCLVCVS